MATVQAPALISLQKILVATDFSPCSQAALRCAAALAQQPKGKVLLAHVLEILPASAATTEPAPAVLDAENSKVRMRDAVAAPEMAGIEHEELIAQGAFWPVLEEMIREHGIELVVVGTHGREGLRKLLLGSQAEQVFRRATCPVLTVGPHVEPQMARDQHPHSRPSTTPSTLPPDGPTPPHEPCRPAPVACRAHCVAYRGA